jgi:UDP-N-acetylglucosamine--N-acetylmuramyl-(pentapeptide) pyrophosphoryl-undecaprenol N-acetylglucosamine transferase
MTSTKKLKRILLSGGGTGGHIYPALAVADEFKKQNPNIQIRFVGSHRGLETKIIPEKGFRLYSLGIGPLHSSVGRLQQLKTLLTLPLVFLHCLWILISFRPQRVMGFGGYASGPIVFMASILFFKTSIWEANVQPGIANRVLSKFVRRCYVVFEESLKHFPVDKTKCYGYPVRQEFDQLYDQKMQTLKAQTSLPYESSKKLKVLAFGGSQGAKILNDLIPLVADANPDMSFTLQTGLKNYDNVIKNQSSNFDNKAKDQNFGLHSNLKILPFLDPIIDHYVKADVIICRSGAGALAELAAIGANCLFVPFALASDNHQYKNALALHQRGAAGLIEEKHLTVEAITGFLQSFKNKSDNKSDDKFKDEQRQTHQKMLAFFKPKATFNMVQDFTNL